MKKYLLAFVAIVGILCFTACSPASSGNADSQSTTTTTVTASQTVTTAVSSEETIKTTTTALTITTIMAPKVTTTTTTAAPTTAATTASYDSLPFTPVHSTEEYFQTLEFYDDATEHTVHYLFHKPLRNSGEPMPLVIFLHGKGDSVTAANPGTATPMVRSLMALENQSYEYSAYTLVPVTPLAHEGQWTQFQIFAFKMLLWDILDRYNIDESRIYLSGVSMGGFMTCQLVSEMPGTFAAAVPISGAQNLSSAWASHGTAFRIYHVATDAVVDVKWSQDLYEQLLNSHHPNAEYTEYPTGSHISPIYTVFTDNRDEFFPWLFRQRLA